MNQNPEPSLRELRQLLGIVIWTGFFVLVSFIRFTGLADQTTPLQTGYLFQLTNIWVVHLRFTTEQWHAMEPKEPANVFGGPGTHRGGGPGGFGPARFIAPAFLKGDRNQDSQLSQAEFLALGEKWFTEWD